MNIDQLRYRGRPVFWRGCYLFADGFEDPGQQFAWEEDGQWRAFAAHDETAEIGCSEEPIGKTDGDARADVLRCLVDNDVLTVVYGTPAAAVTSPAAAPMKFIRLPAPLPWKANEILRTADVNAIYGDVSTYTVDIPAAKADAIVALLLLLDINAKSYEV